MPVELSDLSSELLYKILYELDLDELIHLGYLSRRFNNLIKDELENSRLLTFFSEDLIYYAGKYRIVANAIVQNSVLFAKTSSGLFKCIGRDGKYERFDFLLQTLKITKKSYLFAEAILKNKKWLVELSKPYDDNIAGCIMFKVIPENPIIFNYDSIYNPRLKMMSRMVLIPLAAIAVQHLSTAVTILKNTQLSEAIKDVPEYLTGDGYQRVECLYGNFFDYQIQWLKCIAKFHLSNSEFNALKLNYSFSIPERNRIAGIIFVSFISGDEVTFLTRIQKKILTALEAKQAQSLTTTL